MFDNVTIMFSYMVGFAEICSQASAMKIVECINNVFTMFDNIIDKYDVFKVRYDPVSGVTGISETFEFPPFWFEKDKLFC